MSRMLDQSTRLLCASVLFNHGGARNTVLGWIRDPNRAVAPEMGIDVRLAAQLARFAERRERHYWRLFFGVFAACAMVALSMQDGSELTDPALAIIAIGVLVTAAISLQKQVQERNEFLPMFLSGRFNPKEVGGRFGAELSERELSGLSTEQQDLFVYAGFMPFVGAGHDLGGWSVAVAIDKQKEHLGVTMPLLPFTIAEVYSAIDSEVQTLWMPGIDAKDCFFTQGSDLGADSALLPDRFGRPVQSLDREAARRYLDSDDEQVRHYRRYQIVDWGGELVLSYFLRCAIRGNTLFVETKRFILTPLAPSFRTVDALAPMDLHDSVALVIGCSVLSPFLLLASPFWFVADVSRMWREAWGTEEKERKQLIEKHPLYNYGCATSLRERLGSGEYARYFQKMDGDLFNKALEREVLDSLIAFLDEHGVETSDLKERQTTILNSGVIVQGGDVKAESLAVGAGSKAMTTVKKAFGKAAAAGAAE